MEDDTKATAVRAPAKSAPGHGVTFKSAVSQVTDEIWEQGGRTQQLYKRSTQEGGRTAAAGGAGVAGRADSTWLHFPSRCAW